MKFSCSNCKARYQLPDEKVVGRTLRMNCRQCKSEIVIRGEDASARMTLSQAPMPLGSLRPDSLPSPRMESRLSLSLSQAPAPTPLGARTSAAPVSFAGARMSDAPTPLGNALRGRASSVSPLAAPAVVAAPPPLARALADAWHVGINDVSVGPMRREEVAQKIALGAIDLESLCWREGMEDWRPLRHVPELAALYGSIVPPPPEAVVAPPLPMHPAPGRVSTVAAMPQWSAALPDPSLSQVPHHVAPSESVVPPAPGGANWAKMFAMAGGLTLLMTATVIFGVKYLSSEPQPVAPVVASAPVPAPAAPGAAAPNVAAPEEQVQPALEFTLEEAEAATAQPTARQGANGDARRAEAAAATAAPGEPAKKPSGPTKALTAAQKEMLARMGGGLDSDPALLQAPTTARSTGSSSAATGSLTAAQLNQVRLRGQENLKRCYETALRSAGGSTETLRMDVELTISPSGNVTQVDATGPSLAGMDTCIERNVRMWRFPSSGETTQTKFPVVFQPGG